MIEYTHELMNSDGEVIDFVRHLVMRVIGDKLIETQVWKKIREKKTKVIYDLTTEQNTREYCIQYDHRQIDYNLAWKYAFEIIIKELKKIFIDSNVYSKNKEVYDIQDNVTIHRLIIVDWR